jgi:hypothetical protein
VVRDALGTTVGLDLLVSETHGGSSVNLHGIGQASSDKGIQVAQLNRSMPFNDQGKG